MQTLGIRSGWVFFEHAGSALAVDLRTGDVTDVFSADSLAGDTTPDWVTPDISPELNRAEILARATFASSVDSSRIYKIPQTVRASAQRALTWQRIYKRGTLIASAMPKDEKDFVVPPKDVRSTVAFAVGRGMSVADQLSNSERVPVRLVERMHLFFSRHSKKSTMPDVWNAWGGDAGRDWSSRVMASRGLAASTVTEALANADVIDYDTLKLLPRAFSVLPSPHTTSCQGDGKCNCGGSRDSGQYPSERAITYAALGGDDAMVWSDEIVRNEELRALAAAAKDVNAGVVADEEANEEIFNANEPHVFAPIPTYPVACLYCLKDEEAEVHDDDAVDYEIADITPEDAHYFTEDRKNPEKCGICGKAVDDTVHRQAALAAYYDNKADWDKRYAETRQYWEGQEQGISAAASTFGVDWVEGDLFHEADFMERATLIDEEMDSLAWQRRDDFDSMCYYAAYSGDDSLMIDQIYVSDGPLLFRYDPMMRRWEETSLASEEQIFEIDDESAHEAIRALSLHPELPVDLREVDPGEAFLMESTLPLIDVDMIERTVVASVTGLFAEYTPEERSENARRQVRDKSGRFARAGSSVMTPKGAGTVKKIDPDNQTVEVAYADGQPSEWVPAQQVSVVPTATPPAVVPPKVVDPKLLPSLIKNIPGKPRAVASTAKARLPQLLQPMNAETLARVVSDYEKQIAEDQDKLYPIEQWEKEETTPPNKRPRLVAAGDKGIPTASPEKSTTAPMYLAVVDEADGQSVLDLLAMTPASSKGTETVLWRRDATGWIQDDQLLREMRSSAPPPIVKLDEATYSDVLTQVDAFFKSPEGKQSAEDDVEQAPVVASIYGPYGELIAAGIPGVADTPEDIANVNRLKRYWTIGAGGLKIRWNTPGDMTRCMRQLRKYMQRPGMAEGYCARLHHQMTGEWPGDRRNVGRRASGAPTLFDAQVLSTDEVIAYSALVAGAQVQLDGTPVPTEANQVPTELTGAPFVIPVAAPVGVKSGDGRKFSPLALSWRELPLPLLWQVQTQDGHDASVIVGRIDSIERGEDGSLINARGVFDTGPYGKEAERLVRHKFLRGVSVDLDDFEAEARPALPEEDEDAEEMGVVKIRPDEMTITKGRAMGMTLVAKPAFQEVTIEIDEPVEEVEEMADGTYIGTPGTDAETEEMVRSALVAAGIPLNPPVEWFDDPKLTERTPLTIEDDGRVYGHIATWDVEHIGLPFSTTPPRSRSKYAYFHTGVLRTQQGVDVPVGQVTLAGGHANLNADAAMAVKHYDDTASAMCDVHAGEDKFGIWVAGALRPNVTGEQIRAMRASAPSGDWRPINGRLEMVAVCQVNVPGFPTVRARVASGHVFALVAAGTATLNKIRANASVDDKLDLLLERLDRIEAPQRAALAAAREAATERINVVRSERANKAREKFTQIAQQPAQFRDYSDEKREEMAKKGEAMPGGGYPIANVADLKNAIRAYGRAASGEKTKVRRHIQKRAKALGKTDLIPESWKSLAVVHEDVMDAITMSLLAAGGRYPNGEPWNPTNHPRDEHGRFRQVIARLRSDLEGEVGTAEAVEKLNEAEEAQAGGDPDAAERAAQEVLEMVDELTKNSDDKGVVETLRSGYTNLAEAIANLPLEFGDLNAKYRYTDLPDELQGLIEDLVSRGRSILDNEDFQQASGKLVEFMAGGDVLSQPDISSELSKLLRFLI